MWLLVVFRYRASVRLSKISKVEIYTPPQMKFLATPLLNDGICAHHLAMKLFEHRKDFDTVG